MHGLPAQRTQIFIARDASNGTIPFILNWHHIEYEFGAIEEETFNIVNMNQ